MRAPLRLGLCAAALAAMLVAARFLVSPAAAEPMATGARPVVLLELFSSEGCSSCPPADALLARLAEERVVAGAEVIPLELHVDYWNQLGWPDPFSSPAFTARQEAYARALGERGAYTPELVVDGRVGIVGSDERGVRALVAKAAGAPKAKVAIEVRGAIARVEVEGAALREGDAADLVVAVTEDDLVTDVRAGENRGRRLAHAPVVRWLSKPIAIDASSAPRWTTTVEIPTRAEWRAGHMRAVAFVQRRRSMRVEGAAVARVP